MTTETSFRIEQITHQLTWQIRQEVMWPEEPLEFVQLEEDPMGLHYGLFDQNRLWSVVSVFIKNGSAQFRKFATRSEMQGKGYGTALLNYLIADLKTFEVNRIWCNARLDKVPFYQKFGFTSTNQTFTKKGISYVIMELLMTGN